MEGQLFKGDRRPWDRRSVAAISSKQWGDDMTSTEREPILGVWGRAPSRVQG